MEHGDQDGDSTLHTRVFIATLISSTSKRRLKPTDPNYTAYYWCWCAQLNLVDGLVERDHAFHVAVQATSVVSGISPPYGEDGRGFGVCRKMLRMVLLATVLDIWWQVLAWQPSFVHGC